MPLYALGTIEPQIHPDAVVHPDAVIIGRVTIGAGSTIAAGVVMRGDDGDIVIGERSTIDAGCVFHTTPWVPTVVRDGCTIGTQVHLEGCTIEDGAVLGANTVALQESVVGAGTTVEPGSLVPGRLVVPPGITVRGTPVKLG